MPHKPAATKAGFEKGLRAGTVRRGANVGMVDDNDSASLPLLCLLPLPLPPPGPPRLVPWWAIRLLLFERLPMVVLPLLLP